MPTVFTTHGLMDESKLQLVVEVENNPNDVAIGVCWYYKDHTGEGCAFCGNPDLPRPDLQRRRTLVRRSVWVDAKRPMEAMTGETAKLGV